MSRRPRRNHTPGFKAKVALAAIKGALRPNFVPTSDTRLLVFDRERRNILLGIEPLPLRKHAHAYNPHSTQMM